MSDLKGLMHPMEQWGQMMSDLKFIPYSRPDLTYELLLFTWTFWGVWIPMVNNTAPLKRWIITVIKYSFLWKLYLIPECSWQTMSHCRPRKWISYSLGPHIAVATILQNSLTGVWSLFHVMYFLRNWKWWRLLCKSNWADEFSFSWKTYPSEVTSGASSYQWRR